jgi:hypothetical protein
MKQQRVHDGQQEVARSSRTFLNENTAMRRPAALYLLVVMICMLAASSHMTLAQNAPSVLPRCTEGRTTSGACVNSALAAELRQTAIIFSQPKISLTAYPVLPAQDAKYRYPNQLIPNPARPSPVAGPGVP